MKEGKARAIADQLIRAAEVFAASPWAEAGRASWSVWWYRVPEAKELFDLAVKDVVRSNPVQLSIVDTERALTYQSWSGSRLSTLALAPAGVDKDQLRENLTKQVLHLANMRRSQRLEFIVENIVLNEPAPRFLGVELVPIPDDEIQGFYGEVLLPQINTNALAFARVEAFGDSTMAFNRSLQTIERYLNLLRGCGVQFMLGQSLLPLRVLRGAPADERIGYREGPGPGAWSMRILDTVRGVRVYEDLLASLHDGHINALVVATTGSTTPLLEAVVSCLETLGEATKRHSNATRILLVSSALEMLIGFGVSDNIIFRGQTAAIAERAAFLIGGATTDERKAMDRRMRRLYGTGSAVRHGKRPAVSDDEVGELASLTHRVALTLIDCSAGWQKPEDIDTWVTDMRYS